MKKQTAVEWLQEAMSNKLSSEIGPYFLDLFEQAKEMEKDQIEEAYWDGYQNIPSMKPEQYYNETYGN
jgi:hypothetical protein